MGSLILHRPWNRKACAKTLRRTDGIYFFWSNARNFVGQTTIPGSVMSCYAHNHLPGVAHHLISRFTDAWGLHIAEQYRDAADRHVEVAADAPIRVDQTHRAFSALHGTIINRQKSKSKIRPLPPCPRLDRLIARWAAPAPAACRKSQGCTDKSLQSPRRCGRGD